MGSCIACTSRRLVVGIPMCVAESKFNVEVQVGILVFNRLRAMFHFVGKKMAVRNFQTTYIYNVFICNLSSLLVSYLRILMICCIDSSCAAVYQR